jgi:hypothetical protein
MKMPSNHAVPHRLASRSAILLLIAGMVLVSCSTSNLPWKNFHYPPPPPLPLHQPPFAPPITPPWKELVAKYPSLAKPVQTSCLAEINTVTKNNNLISLCISNRTYYESPVCIPSDLRLTVSLTNGNNQNVKTVSLHHAIYFSFMAYNRSSRLCSIVDGIPYPGTNGMKVGDCLAAYVVRNSLGKTIWVGDSADRGPFVKNVRNLPPGCYSQGVLAIPPGTTPQDPVGGSMLIGRQKATCLPPLKYCGFNQGPEPPPGRYSVTAVIASGQYEGPCRSCSNIGTVEPIYSKPAYFTIKD